MDWLEKFKQEHAGRLIMMAITIVLGAISIGAGKVANIPALVSTGVTAVTGVVILALNKTRSPKEPKPEE